MADALPLWSCSMGGCLATPLLCLGGCFAIMIVFSSWECRHHDHDIRVDAFPSLVFYSGECFAASVLGTTIVMLYYPFAGSVVRMVVP